MAVFSSLALELLGLIIAEVDAGDVLSLALTSRALHRLCAPRLEFGVISAPSLDEPQLWAFLARHPEHARNVRSLSIGTATGGKWRIPRDLAAEQGNPILLADTLDQDWDSDGPDPEDELDRLVTLVSDALKSMPNLARFAWVLDARVTHRGDEVWTTLASHCRKLTTLDIKEDPDFGQLCGADPLWDLNIINITDLLSISIQFALEEEYSTFDGVVSLLKNSPRLEKLELSWIYANETFTAPLDDLLPEINLPHLRALKLMRVCADDDAVCDFFRLHPQLERFGFSDTYSRQFNLDFVKEGDLPNLTVLECNTCLSLCSALEAVLKMKSPVREIVDFPLRECFRTDALLLEGLMDCLRVLAPRLDYRTGT